MDESPTALPNDTFLQNSWTEDADWWLGALEEDTLSSVTSLLPQFGSDLLSTFLPPPPWPSFLEIPTIPSCDLCGWAWQEAEGTKGDVQGDMLLILDGAKTNETAVDDSPHEFGWVLALIIVSIISAVLGAIIMVTAIQCRNRLKNIRSRGVCSLCQTVGGSPDGHGACIGASELHGDDANKGQSHSSAVNSLGLPPMAPSIPQSSSIRSGGIWTWLTTRRSGRYNHEPSPHVERRHHYTPENHYTLSSTGRVPPLTAVGIGSIAEEALYAELDHRDEDIAEGGIQSPEYEDPSYQNMAYQGVSEMDPLSCRLSASSPLSSSSAYYSDLSTSAQATNAGWEATYEAVDTEPRLPPVIPPNAIEIRPSDGRREMIMPHEEVSDTVAISCRENDEEEEHVMCKSRHHICPLPVTKTVPSDYV